jgi:ABC-2 type transport system ATP-binding protein
MTIQESVERKSGPAMTGEVTLRTINLTKRFGQLVAVKDLNLELHRGEVFCFLGPNGAGKSTTVGMILGLVAPTSGSIEIFGQNLMQNRWAVLRKVGAIIEEPAFYPYLSGRNNLKALSIAIGGIPDGKIDEVLERVNLLDRANDRYDHYSMGMKQRLGIASTLLRDPELIILDEPTSGLDPAGTKEVRELIPKLSHENRTIFLCSHILHEVEMVCQRVAIIKQGSLLACAPINELTSRGPVLQIKVKDVDLATSVVKALPWVKSIKIENGYLIVDAPADSAWQINAALADKKIYLSELLVRTTSLEDVFLELTGGESGD